MERRVYDQRIEATGTEKSIRRYARGFTFHKRHRINIMTNIQHILDLAVAREVRSVRHHFTEEEQTSALEKFAQVALRRADEEEAFLQVKKDWKVRLDEIKEEEKSKRKLVREKFVDRDADVALLPNFDSGMMEIYDATTGEMVEERKLRPNERQTNILQARAAV